MQLIPQTVLTLQTASALFSFAVDVLHVVLDSVELRLSAQSPPGQFQARRPPTLSVITKRAREWRALPESSRYIAQMLERA